MGDRCQHGAVDTNTSISTNAHVCGFHGNRGGGVGVAAEGSIVVVSIATIMDRLKTLETLLDHTATNAHGTVVWYTMLCVCVYECVYVWMCGRRCMCMNIVYVHVCITHVW